MKTFETTAIVSAEHRLTVDVPCDVMPGAHRIVIVIDDLPDDQMKPPLDLPDHDLGPWPGNLSLRREDLYDEWGR